MSDFYPGIFAIQMLGVVSSLLLIWYSLRYSDRPETKWFQALMVCALGWSLVYGLEISYGNLAWKEAMLELRFLFVPYMGLVTFGLAMELCGRGAWLTRKRLVPLMVIPVLSTIFGANLLGHGLLKNIVGIDHAGPFPVLVLTNGPWFYIMNIQIVCLAAAACILLGRQALHSRPIYRNQSILLIAVFIVPITVNYLFQFGITPIYGYDPVSTTFAFTNLLMAWSIFGYGMLDLRPFARNQVIDSMADIMIVEDKRGRIIDANKAASKFLGGEEEDLIGKNTISAFPELARVVGIEHPGSGQHLTMENQAGRRYFDCTIVQLNVRNGEGRLFFLHDATERVLAEEMLKRSEGMSRELLEAAPFPIVITDLATSQVVYLNRRDEEQFKVSKDRLDQLKVVEFYVNPEDRARIHAQLKEHGKIADMEARMLRNDGSEFWALLSATLIEYHDRVCVFTALKDITQRKMATQALGRANERLKLMSSITRHDLTNNMMGVVGYLELVRKEKDPAKRESFFDKTMELASRSQALLRFTKDYQDVGADDPKWQAVSEVITTVKGQLGLGKVVIDDQVDGLIVHADNMLIKVFYNLFENALRHGGGVTLIKVSLERRPEEMAIVIEDNGRGISYENKERIFEKGFGTNTGMGLFLVVQILSITGMSIKENGVPGQAARFEIIVPEGEYKQGEERPN